MYKGNKFKENLSGARTIIKWFTETGDANYKYEIWIDSKKQSLAGKAMDCKLANHSGLMKGYVTALNFVNNESKMYLSLRSPYTANSVKDHLVIDFQDVTISVLR